jgi:gluconolactonase
MVAASCIACSGSSPNSSEAGGTQAVSAGGSSASTIGGTSATGDTDVGGSSATSGGMNATGGTVGTSGFSSSATGGMKSTGGATGTGSSTGGSQATGGNQASGGAAVGGRGAGICPGGVYPVPDLTATATVVTSSTDKDQYEGTLWLDSKGVLLFSGMNTSASGTPATVNQLTLPNTVATAVTDSGTNGLAIDLSGATPILLAASQKVQGIVSFDIAAGSVTTLVNTDASGKHFNCPNDLTVRTDGTIYFTDPDYQLSGRTSETGVKGVYRYSTSKVVSVIDSQFNEPNGITLSPDETVLYVADTGASTIRKFIVAADGSTSGKTDFANVTSPDGGGIDCAGNLYWASNAAPGKIAVISPSGTQLGTISLGASDKPTNVAFGGADHKTLYVSTSPRKIYSIALNIPGFPY